MIVYAQQRPEGPGGFGGQGGWHPSQEDMSAFADARIAALHAGLRLNPDQEKTWPAFEQALRDAAKMRMDRMASAREEQPSTDPVERLQQRADRLTTRGTALKRLADAAAPLYQSLDDGQKHRFALLAHFMGPREGHNGMWQGHPGGMRGESGGMRGGEEFHHDPHHFGGEDGMRNPHGMHDGMRGMHSDDDEDYRGPL
ncbi:MAG TPA: Spy/CpxP family protein refolding chaperone [Xanthobacteraceae bacterium]